MSVPLWVAAVPAGALVGLSAVLDLGLEGTFARNDALDALRERVIAIEKTDIKGEGKTLGQGAVIAAIVLGLTVTGTVISLVVVIANLLSAP